MAIPAGSTGHHRRADQGRGRRDRSPTRRTQPWSRSTTRPPVREVVGAFPGAGDALQGKSAVLTKEGQRSGQSLRRRDQPHIENLTYQKVLDRWKLASEAVPTSEVHPKDLPKTG